MALVAGHFPESGLELTRAEFLLLLSPPCVQLMHKHGAPLPDHVDWGWAGFGGAGLAPVAGVTGVVDAALGGWHALVLTQ
jgi:hypothetical protein